MWLPWATAKDEEAGLRLGWLNPGQRRGPCGCTNTKLRQRLELRSNPQASCWSACRPSRRVGVQGKSRGRRHSQFQLRNCCVSSSSMEVFEDNERRLLESLADDWRL